MVHSNNDIDQRIICSTAFKTMWRAYGKTLGIWSTLIYKRCIIHIYVGLQEGHNGKLVRYMNNHRRSPVSCTPNRGTKHSKQMEYPNIRGFYNILWYHFISCILIDRNSWSLAVVSPDTSLVKSPISKASWFLVSQGHFLDRKLHQSLEKPIHSLWVKSLLTLKSVNLLHLKSAFFTASPVKKNGSFNSPCSETFQYHIANKHIAIRVVFRHLYKYHIANKTLFVLIVPSAWHHYCRHTYDDTCSCFLMYFKSVPVHFSKLMTHIPYGFLKWCISHVKLWHTMVFPKGE